MKSPVIAFLLNFVVTGSGLMYLGKWKWGFLVLGGVAVIGLITGTVLSEEEAKKAMIIIAPTCALGAGAISVLVANDMNSRQNESPEDRL